MFCRFGPFSVVFSRIVFCKLLKIWLIRFLFFFAFYFFFFFFFSFFFFFFLLSFWVFFSLFFHFFFIFLFFLFLVFSCYCKEFLFSVHSYIACCICFNTQWSQRTLLSLNKEHLVAYFEWIYVGRHTTSLVYFVLYIPMVPKFKHAI